MKRLAKVILPLLLVAALVISVSVVAFAEKTTGNEDFAYKTRFENILNNNRAFGNDFSSVSMLIKRSMPTFAKLAEGGKIKTETVAGFIYDMYGVDIYMIPDENGVFYGEEDYIDILPTGFSIYAHSVKEIHENEDGTITVYSKALSNPHDADGKEYDCVAKLLKSDESSFGFVLLSAELLDIE